MSSTYLAKALAAFLACTSRLMRMVSRFTGLGIKPTTPSSFTGRPIHHSLLNFCLGRSEVSFFIRYVFVPVLSESNLFDVEEVSGLKRDGLSWDGHIVVVCGGVGEVAADGKRDGLVLKNAKYVTRLGTSAAHSVDIRKSRWYSLHAIMC